MPVTTGATGLPDGLLDALRGEVGAQHVLLGADLRALDPGWHPDNLGGSALVAPASPQEMAAVVAACRDAGVPIVPHGGRTGLVGGSVAAPGCVMVASRRLNRIERLDPIERVAVVQAGVTLQALQDAAAELGLEPAIDLAARGSATLGGMASTNAGGVMAFRHGVMRHRIVGIEAVLPDGSILGDLTRVIKVSAGYDIKHLLIGAEGTLGIITRLAVRLERRPAATASAMFGLSSVAAALATVQAAVAWPGLRAAEVLWNRYLRLTASAQHWNEPGLGLDRPLYLLLELGGDDPAALGRAFEGLFETVLQADASAGGIVADSMRQRDALWALREDTDAIYRRHPRAPSYDVSVPLSEVEAYVEQVRRNLGGLGFDPYVFGHLADGNLHVVLDCEGPLEASRAEAADRAIYDGLADRGGCFSAEHGVGSRRIGALVATTDPARLACMRAIKQALDPRGLMNPGKVVPV
jgi:FAD/FMN-containing dehydrogenase